MGKKLKKKGIYISIFSAFILMASGITSYAGTWVRDSEKWRYQNDDGSFQSGGWFLDQDGRHYYFDTDGYMLSNVTTPDGFRVGEDGVWIENALLPVMSKKSNHGDIYYSGLRAALDSIPLYPESTTGYEEVDILLDEIFAQIITDEMDTHDKLKACYDYIINRTAYGFNMVWGDSYAMAYGLLKGGQGVCDDYSAAFAVMARKIGLPMYTVGGQTHKSNGEFTPHAWCQLDYNGTTYIFDPQVEDVIGNSKGYIMYIRFGGTTAQLSDKYQYGWLYDDFSK